ncbi:hypothetical protein [uncultured Hymenobacter sp.]|uniref:hypothetical protein n=1 Tax=uncultured Hymenobacter sp. TaxID=170016 RepID=UPI0035CC91C0
MSILVATAGLNAFSPDVALNMQNLVGSHDATRTGSAVANSDGKKFGNWDDYSN